MSLRASKVPGRDKRDGFHLDHFAEEEQKLSDSVSVSSFMAILEDEEIDMEESTKKQSKLIFHKRLAGRTYPILVAAVMLLCISGGAVSRKFQKPTTSIKETDYRDYLSLAGDEDYSEVRRALSINLGGGDCLWTNSKQADQSKPLFTSLIVSYPGSGKRTTFLNLEGLTELVSGDDHKLRYEPPKLKYAFMKTSYPQHHGTWGWEDRSHQALLVVRNPRWAMVSFHATLYEIDFSDSWLKSYQMQHHVYTKRPPLEDWAVFRDLRFDDEIKLWGWLIDFWMEGGLLRNYKTNEMVDESTFNMVLQPHIYTEAEMLAMEPSTEAYYDSHCLDDIPQCQPTAVVSIERIVANETGPDEIAKLAATIEGKPGISMIEEEARECVWKEMADPKVGGKGKAAIPHFPNRDRYGPKEEEFLFTKPQMEKIIEEITRVRDKYSEPEWANNENAQQLVEFFEEYIEENELELATM